MERGINADMRRRAVARTADIPWTASPSGTVWRKRVHLVGPPESGQVTAVVRYEPGAVFPAHDRRHLSLDTGSLDWRRPDGEGAKVETALLYAQTGYPDTACLERWPAGVRLGTIAYPGGVEFFVLRGEWADGEGSCPEGTWVRLPPGSRHSPRSDVGCEIYVKRGGVAGLASSDGASAATRRSE